ncbi:MAG: carboxypeptidase-like regulatory domain-containing protein [Bacteroides sp.]|nr:carboxypeptidase-like regulatory domain-containing protein [Bacteroides sp.]
MKHTGQHDFSKRLIFTICLLLSALSATSLQAQTSTIEISGKVTDALGEPMPGVSVLEKGTTNGMATDLQGEYRITVKSPSSVLLFSFMDFNSVEETVGIRRTIPVTLEENLTVLDDMVVIGYGTTTKKEITGSVSSLSSDDFKAGNVTDPLQLLQG